jgi:hypothetical protein
MMTKRTYIEIQVTANPDLDNCLDGAARAYIAEHPELRGHDLSPRWTDEMRESVTLSVPEDDAARPCTLRPIELGGWYEHDDGTIGEYRWDSQQIVHCVRTVATWADVPDRDAELADWMRSSHRSVPDAGGR